MKRRLLFGLMAVFLGFGVYATTLAVPAAIEDPPAAVDLVVDEAESAAAHGYILSVVCHDTRWYYHGAATTFEVVHIDVRWGFDRHETVAYWASYNQWRYWCYLG